MTHCFKYFVPSLFAGVLLATFVSCSTSTNNTSSATPIPVSNAYVWNALVAGGIDDVVLDMTPYDSGKFCIAGEFSNRIQCQNTAYSWNMAGNASDNFQTVTSISYKNSVLLAAGTLTPQGGGGGMGAFYSVVSGTGQFGDWQQLDTQEYPLVVKAVATGTNVTTSNPVVAYTGGYYMLDPVNPNSPIRPNLYRTFVYSDGAQSVNMDPQGTLFNQTGGVAVTGLYVTRGTTSDTVCVGISSLYENYMTYATASIACGNIGFAKTDTVSTWTIMPTGMVSAPTFIPHINFDNNSTVVPATSCVENCTSANPTYISQLYAETNAGYAPVSPDFVETYQSVINAYLPSTNGGYAGTSHGLYWVSAAGTASAVSPAVMTGCSSIYDLGSQMTDTQGPVITALGGCQDYGFAAYEYESNLDF
jgi:hypothetical protein